jgi:5'-3' exonuclease
MGIHNFFKWYKANFKNTITYNITKYNNLQTKQILIDNLLIDTNGIIHNSAQKIFKYGNYENKINNIQVKQSVFEVYKDVCFSINEIVKISLPQKRIIIAIDGVAPLSKMYQQRQRRYKAFDPEKPLSKEIFTSSAISPGTDFMDGLSRYLSEYISRQLIRDYNWKKLEIIFLNEKTPGEGEHNCINQIKNYDKNETHCFYGADSDIIMLSLIKHDYKFHILRDNFYFKENEYISIYISSLSVALKYMLKCECNNFNEDNSIEDFVFLCISVGNDFLPNIPTLEIIEGGIDTIIMIYKNVYSKYGHFVKTSINGKYKFFNKEALKDFFRVVACLEQRQLEHKFNNTDSYFEDKIYNECIDENKILDITKYRKKYYKQKLKAKNLATLENICHKYLDGLNFVLNYYTNNIPDWEFIYDNNYSPSAFYLHRFIDIYNHKPFKQTYPVLPFVQLLYILHPKHHYLLPEPYQDIHKQPELSNYFPYEFEEDLDGKYQDWQAVAIIPFIDINILKNIHNKYNAQYKYNRNSHGKCIKFININNKISKIFENK